MQDTIFAISTAPGVGGIAVVRISGPMAIAACDSVFKPLNAEHRLLDRKSHTATFGQIIDPSTSEVLDEVVVTLFRAPHSFTGEDVVEISCHGSLYIQQQILELLASAKVTNNLPPSEGGSGWVFRLAHPGEFTRRAFANGRFDLTQAEAVADLISAQSAASHRLALKQMKGSISQKLSSLHDQLLQLTSLLELELDFSEEEVEFADRQHLLALTTAIQDEVQHLASTFQQGQAIKNGIPVAIIGAPNVGKSTLLNALLREDRAIVSDIQGTTRDLIEDTITLGGYLFRFIDTAGIRHTTDTIERLGIERSHQAAQRAQIILLLTEPGIEYPDIEPQEGQHLIYILNKVDTTDCPPIATLDYPSTHLSISAKNRLGIEALEIALIDCVSKHDTQSDVILTNVRHRDALLAADEALTRVRQGLSSGLSHEFVAMDLRAVISSLNSILGREITSQDTLNNIFSHFCIGK